MIDPKKDRICISDGVSTVEKIGDVRAEIEAA